jgi:hypothetical protein
METRFTRFKMCAGNLKYNLLKFDEFQRAFVSLNSKITAGYLNIKNKGQIINSIHNK